MMPLVISIIALCIALYALSETSKPLPEQAIDKMPREIEDWQSRIREHAHRAGSMIYGISIEEAKIYAGSEPEDTVYIIKWYELAHVRILEHVMRMEDARAQGVEITADDMEKAEKLHNLKPVGSGSQPAWESPFKQAGVVPSEHPRNAPTRAVSASPVVEFIGGREP